MKVVDASVALGWLLREPPADAHRRLLDDHVAGREPLIAPELLHYEVANVLAVGADLPAAAALDAFERFAALGIETYSLGLAEYRAALGLAAGHGVSVYDASYAALALTLGIRLVTADRKLARRLQALDVADVI